MRIGGIPLRVHPSWFIILVLFTMAFQQQVASTMPETTGTVSYTHLTLPTIYSV